MPCGSSSTSSPRGWPRGSGRVVTRAKQTLLAPLNPRPAGATEPSEGRRTDQRPRTVPGTSHRLDAPANIRGSAAPAGAWRVPSDAALPSTGATHCPRTPRRTRRADEDSIPIGVGGRHGSTGDPAPRGPAAPYAVIFAGSGSGKTVLIRRLIEECALRGVSAIVLDPNNDLARLGLPWPEPPADWSDGDAETAATYLRDTEVVVWTPRLTTGRPLSFAPLAGLRDVADDPDEFEIALDSAVASLVPRSGLPASGARLSQGRAVLKEALAAYVRGGGADLPGFLGYLSTLPAGVSQACERHEARGRTSRRRCSPRP